jgi:hypothetical protein
MSMRAARGVFERGAVINQEALPLPGHESILFAEMKFLPWFSAAPLPAFVSIERAGHPEPRRPGIATQGRAPTSQLLSALSRDQQGVICI